MKIGILFDLDGTLVDTLQDLTECTNDILRKYGFAERTTAQIRSFVGNGARVLIQKALPEGSEDALVDKALADYEAHYREFCRTHEPVLYPGIGEAMAQVQAEFPVAVVSNKPDAATQAICDRCFDGVYARGVLPDCPRKPAPDMLQAAMRALNVDSCVYVGDSEVDILTANNTGVPCLSVTWGFRDVEQLEQAGGKYFCSRQEDILPMLRQIIEENF